MACSGSEPSWGSPDLALALNGACNVRATMEVTSPSGSSGYSIGLFRKHCSAPTFQAGEKIATISITGTGTYTYDDNNINTGKWYYQARLECEGAPIAASPNSSVQNITVTCQNPTLTLTSNEICQVQAAISLGGLNTGPTYTIKLYRKAFSAPTFDAGEVILTKTSQGASSFSYNHLDTPGDGIWYYAVRADDGCSVTVTSASDYVQLHCADPAEKKIVLVAVTGTPTSPTFTDKRLLNASEQRLEWDMYRNGGCAAFRFLTREDLSSDINSAIASQWEIHVRIRLPQDKEYTTWYRGVIRSIKQNEDHNGPLVDVRGYGYLEMLDSIIVNKSYAAGQTVKEIVDDIILNIVKPKSRIVRPMDLEGGSDTGVDASTYALAGEVHFSCTAIEAIKFLAELQGQREFGVDASRKFFFRAHSSTVGKAFFLAKDVAEYLKGGAAFNNLNQIRVQGKHYGGEIFAKTREDSTDITNNGLYEKLVEIPWVTHDTDANRWADNVIAKYKGRQDWRIFSYDNVKYRHDSSNPWKKVRFYGINTATDVADFEVAKIRYYEGGWPNFEEITEISQPHKSDVVDQQPTLRAIYYLGFYPHDAVEDLHNRILSQVNALKGHTRQLDGRFAFPPLSPSQLTGDQNNYDPETSTTRSTLWRLSSDASRTITGIVAPNEDGRKLILANVGAFPIVLANESISSTAANRIITGTLSDVTIGADEIAELIYDKTTARWRMNAKPYTKFVGTVNKKVLRIESIATNDDPNLEWYQGRVQTTNQTITTVNTIVTSSDKVYSVKVRLVGRRTDAAGHYAGEHAAVYKNAGGTLTKENDATIFDLPAAVVTASFGVSGTDMLFRVEVVGAGQTWVWHTTVTVQEVGT